MVSSERIPCQLFSNFTPHCQRRSCSHRDCPRRGCSRTCLNIFWCPQCTRFWCEDCWKDVDAHQPIEMEMPGMEHHEQTTPKFVIELKNLPRPETKAIEEDSTENRSVAQQEKEDVAQESNTADASSSPTDRIAGLSAPLGYPEHQVEFGKLEGQNKRRLLVAQQEQENLAQQSNTVGRSSSSADQMGRDNLKRSLNGLPRSPMPVSATLSQTLQVYDIHMSLLKQQNKAHLLMARQGQESVARGSVSAGASSSTADQTARSPSHSQNHAVQDYYMQLDLLEHQNKKRVLMARQEWKNVTQRSNSAGASSSPTDQME